jgi:hypothetical protein
VSAAVVVPIPARAKDALVQAAREVADAQRAQADLLAGILLAASDVDLSRVARWDLAPEGLALTLTPPPQGPPA